MAHQQQRAIPMSDVYVYFFMGRNGPSGENICSRQRATLETISGKGQPVMESQIVIDRQELDSSGFFTGTFANESPRLNDLDDEIQSLELRAASRDSEARSLDENTAGADKYMLQLESRELRKQAARLRTHHAELVAAVPGNLNIARSGVNYACA